MSAEKSNALLVMVGVVTGLATIVIQVSSLGEIKGRLEATIHHQDQRITFVETVVREHDRLIYQNLSTKQQQPNIDIKK